MQEISVMGIDLAKNVFEVTGRDAQGRKVVQKQVRRKDLVSFVAQRHPRVVAMEACGGAHHWGRVFQGLGPEVKLVSAQFVKPYVKSNKNDEADSEAICEAASRPHMRFVPLKTIAQQDILALHRVRERLVKNRTALCNEIRGFLTEYGLVMGKGVRELRRRLPEILADADNGLTDRFREILLELAQELRELQTHIESYEEKIEAICRSQEVYRRIQKIPGVGVLTATAVVATMGDGRAFRNGREFAAWVGLVPRQHSSGGKPRLLGISKRGDKYVRKLLIHGGRAVLRALNDTKTDRRSDWLRKLEARRGKNKAAVALANKNARILWALIARQQEYQPRVA